MKIMFFATLLLSCMAVAQQQEKVVSVPESKLTEQQKAEFMKAATIQEQAKGWAGIGDEIGHAVNNSMAAITTQSNNFAQTPVGKLTVLIVIWKVVGDQAVHVAGGIVEIIFFVPLWIWSFRKTGIVRRALVSSEGWPIIGKKTWQVLDDQDKSDKDSRELARYIHLGVGILMIIIVAFTVFSY